MLRVWFLAGSELDLPQLLHRCCQVLAVLVDLHSRRTVAVDLKPSNLLLSQGQQQDGHRQQQQGQQSQQGQQQQEQERLVLADAGLHLRMARAFGELWPTKAALADPFYK